ncbi:MAG: hypothetical protein ACJ8J0_06080 [Longimicrobiaceae bacterium]
MNTAQREIEAKVAEVRAEYASRGFDVIPDPGPELIPFDLAGYRPRLLMRRGDEHYLVEVRHLGIPFSVDRLIEVTDEVRKHRGWHLLLVTTGDVPYGAPGIYEPLASWPKLRRRVASAVHLADSGRSPEAALLALWAALEGVLRKSAQRLSLPVERLPTSQLLPNLYTYGGLTLEQYETLEDVLRVRDRIAFGYDAAERDVTHAGRALAALLPELLPQVTRKAA